MNTLWDTTQTKEPILRIWREINAREQREQSSSSREETATEDTVSPPEDTTN
ncbi:MAG: hypothetical protein N3A54_04195 [Patescibacteria group bacterium]|nr:hypothetical protein [Patescibacteria group bacterium]